MRSLQDHPHLRALVAKWPAIFLVIVLLVMFFLPSLGQPDGRISSYSHDLAHFPIFAVIAAVLLYLWPGHRSAVARTGVVMGVLVSLAIVIELFQPLAGRSAALGDILLGNAGSFAAVAVYLGLRSASDRARRWLCVTAGLLLIVSLLPLLFMLADRFSARRAFPLIDSFERPVEVGRWVAQGCTLVQTTDHATLGRFAMRFEVTSNDEYPSAFLADGIMDWRGRRQLTLDVYLEAGGSRVMWLRADDRDNPPYHERAQVSIELKPGANRIAFDVEAFALTPGGRPLNLGRVQTFGLFLENAKPGDVLYVDHIGLSGRRRTLLAPASQTRSEGRAPALRVDPSGAFT